jgi:hypothetical protein
MKKNILVTANDFGSSKTNPGQSPKHHFCCQRVREYLWCCMVVRVLWQLTPSRASYMHYAVRRPKICSSHRQNFKL